MFSVQIQNTELIHCSVFNEFLFKVQSSVISVQIQNTELTHCSVFNEFLFKVQSSVIMFTVQSAVLKIQNSLFGVHSIFSISKIKQKKILF